MVTKSPRPAVSSCHEAISTQSEADCNEQANEYPRAQHREQQAVTTLPTAFTPVASLLGGALIGLAATLLMLVHGRIMGATGILTGAIQPEGEGDRGWRVATLAGMASAPLAYLVFTGAPAPLEVPVSTAMLVLGGLIVGVGVTLGGGCTSGHGVCGLARLSPRSFVATLTFMATTFVTVFVVRHVFGA